MPSNDDNHANQMDPNNVRTGSPRGMMNGRMIGRIWLTMMVAMMITAPIR